MAAIEVRELKKRDRPRTTMTASTRLRASMIWLSRYLDLFTQNFFQKRKFYPWPALSPGGITASLCVRCINTSR